MKLTLLWPPELIITESLFRHYTGIAEIAGYLVNSRIVKEKEIEIAVEDCAVELHTALNMARIAYSSQITAIFINMNNITEAIKTAQFFKSVEPGNTIVAYGEAVACNPKLFIQSAYIDYAIANGQNEYALEYVICKLTGEDFHGRTDLDDRDIIDLEGIITIDRMLPANRWGLPAFDKLPFQDYLALGNGEIHLLVNKGCPFHCEFCNERLVSSNKLYYRNQDQVVDFLCTNYGNQVKSAYLDASTFTYDRGWVLEMCRKVIQRDYHLPWKTCTRLDCIDKDLICAMASAGCTRISLGIETFDSEIQKRNRKPIDLQKLAEFAGQCIQHGIKPRALLIIGQEKQQKNDLEYAHWFCVQHGIDARFRVLQDYSAVIHCNSLDQLDTTKLDRWNTWNPFNDMSITELRRIEYPAAKCSLNNYI